MFQTIQLPSQSQHSAGIHRQSHLSLHALILPERYTEAEQKGSARLSRLVKAVLLLALLPAPLPGQTAAPDLALTEARAWIGRALFLRGFYAAGDLHYDDSGRLLGAPPKILDWTLAGMDVQTVERKGLDAIELAGVRVAIRYNRDTHLFERHPQKDERLKVTVSAGLHAETVARSLNAIYAVGIDPPLQRSMSDAWRHYFDPRLPWAKDALEGQKIVGIAESKNGPLVYPVATHRVDAVFTAEAERDHVQGKVGLSLVVDADGTPRRIAIQDPLGYGLDARAAEAVTRWRFAPGALDGRPVAAGVVLTEEFVLVPVHP